MTQSQQPQLAARFSLDRVNPAVRSAGDSQKSNLAELDTSKFVLDSRKSLFDRTDTAYVSRDDSGVDENAFKEAARSFEREFSVYGRLAQQSVDESAAEESSLGERTPEADGEFSSGDPRRYAAAEELIELARAEARSAEADQAEEAEEVELVRSEKSLLEDGNAETEQRGLLAPVEEQEPPEQLTQAAIRERADVRAEQEAVKAAAEAEQAEAAAQQELRAAIESEQQDVRDAVELQELRERDYEIRRHVAAHKAAPGPYGEVANYEFKTGPDGRQYAVDGDVMIEVSAANSPEETVERMNMIIATALAPSDPSAEDRAAAQLAQSIKEQALAELRALEMDAALSKYQNSEPQSVESGESNDAAVEEARRAYEEAAQLAQQAAFGQMRGANDQSSDYLYGLA